MKKIIILVLLLSLVSGCIETVVPSDDIQTFEVRPVCLVNSHYLNGNFTCVGLKNNTTTLIDWKDPVISFTVWAHPLPGSTTDDHVTIYFSVEDFDTEIFKFNGAYQLLWNETGTNTLWYESGSKTMPFRKQFNITLTLDVSIYDLSLKTQSDLVIKFRNKERTWEKSYNFLISIVEVQT